MVLQTFEPKVVSMVITTGLRWRWKKLRNC